MLNPTLNKIMNKKTLLHIDSSPLYGMSVSRELTATFVAQWKIAHPGGRIIYRDLNATAIPPLTAAWVAAAYTPDASRTEEQKQQLSLSDAFIGELQEAAEWVIGVPMHNFGIPSVLKLWIDQVVRAGKAFVYVDGKPQGLLTGKKVTFIVATGGMYDAGTQMASFNHVEPYLKSVFGFIGVRDATFLTTGGTMALRHGTDRSTFLAPHIQAAQRHANRAH
jgi:FMN-dependent NADH-azoreductase